eukprot:gene9206-6477_t
MPTRPRTQHPETVILKWSGDLLDVYHDTVINSTTPTLHSLHLSVPQRLPLAQLPSRASCFFLIALLSFLFPRSLVGCNDCYSPPLTRINLIRHRC